MEYKSLTPEQAAYIAGFIDGEGCITSCYHKSSGRTRVRVDVWQVDPRPLVWMKELMGGYLYPPKAKPTNKISKKPIWQFCFCDGRVDAYLPQLLPYLKVKKEKAEIALQVRAIIRANGKRKITPEGRARRFELVQLAVNRK